METVPLIAVSPCASVTLKLIESFLQYTRLSLNFHSFPASPVPSSQASIIPLRPREIIMHNTSPSSPTHPNTHQPLPSKHPRFLALFTCMDKYIIHKKTRQASKRQQRPLFTNTATVSVNYLPLKSPQIETLVYTTHCKKENRKNSATQMVNERNSDEENYYNTPSLFCVGPREAHSQLCNQPQKSFVTSS